MYVCINLVFITILLSCQIIRLLLNVSKKPGVYTQGDLYKFILSVI